MGVRAITGGAAAMSPPAGRGLEAVAAPLAAVAVVTATAGAATAAAPRCPTAAARTLVRPPGVPVTRVPARAPASVAAGAWAAAAWVTAAPDDVPEEEAVEAAVLLMLLSVPCQ